VNGGSGKDASIMKRKIAIVCLLLFVSALMFSSCSVVNSLPHFGHKKAMLKYMEEKYDESFVYEYTARNGAQEYVDIYVLPEAHKDDYDYEIRVRRYNDTGEIIDSYFNILFREGAVKELERMTNEIFGQCVVYNSLGNDALVPSGITKGSSALEFLQADTFFCDIATTYDVSGKEDAVQKFIAELEEKDIILNIRILFVTE
jgi:hypothetical protein